jgi:hypothetical protein
VSAKIPRAGFLSVPGSSVSAAQIIETPCLVVRHQVFTNPPVADVDGVIATHIHSTVAGAETLTVLPASMDGATAPLGVLPMSCGQNITINVVHASSIVAVSGTITGYDMYGNVITETWAVTATGTDKTATGNKAFKKITSITFVTVADGRANEYTAGYGSKLGLDRICASAKFVNEECDGAQVTAGTIVKGVAASATADARGTYVPNTTANGAHDYDVWYIVETVDKITQ